MLKLEAIINFGAQLGEPTVTWEFDTEEEIDDMLNYLTATLNPLNINWCYTILEEKYESKIVSSKGEGDEVVF